MRDNLGWILFVGALIVIGIMYFNPKSQITVTSKPSEDDNKQDEDVVKCELKGYDGKIITITGRADDPQFQKLCQQQQNQQVYVYGFPYQFIRYWRPRPHPMPPPPAPPPPPMPPEV